MITALIVIFLVLLVIGVPIAYCMGVSSFAALFLYMPNATSTLASKMFGGLDSFSLMAVPYFLLAGSLMDASGISKQLIEFAELLVGRIKGGLAMSAVVAGVVFAGVSGSNAADTSAIGAIMIPSMTERGYEKSWSCCLISTVGILGPIIPPSILAILYSAATGQSVGALFVAGIIPGLILGLTLLGLCIVYARKNPEVAVKQERKSPKEAAKICMVALPALVMPVIIVGGILTGIFTATESAAIACVYATLYGFISKKLTLKNLWKAVNESAVTVCKLMLIVSLATLFGWILSVKAFPATVAAVMTGITTNKYVILLLVILLLLFVGCFMETIAALTILVPVLAPLAASVGIGNIHFAMLVIVALLVGAITPPVGINLYITSGIAGIRFSDTLKHLLPFVFVAILVTFLVAYVPAVTTWIPELCGYVI